MNITMILNGKKISADIDADMLLIDFVRDSEDHQRTADHRWM